MLTLTLLRHTKSSWEQPDLSDFDRPLARRGETAAPLMGRAIARHKPGPELILCSSAMRTRQTLALALPEMTKPRPEIHYEDGLYLASPASIIERLRAVATDVEHIMIIGHNPGLHALALELIGDGRRKSINDLARKFPTGALAVLDFPASGSWSAIHAATGTLRLFTTPREQA